MVDLNSKNMGGLIAILTIFNYFISIIPDAYKLNITVIGFSTSVLVYFAPSVKNKLIRPTINRILAILRPEKYFRFLYSEKTVIIDENGNGNVTIIYKLLNESGFKRRFPVKFWTTTGAVIRSLEQLEKENKFEVKSLDEHPLRWETISDGANLKEFYIIFDRDLRPGDTREYMFRYETEGLFKTKKSDLPSGKKESTAFIPIHISELFKLKIHFLPRYKYSNLRYCIKSPSKEEVDGMCKDLQSKFDKETGGSYVELEEKYPWRNFEYIVEWIPEN